MGYITIFTERISIHALCEEGDLFRVFSSVIYREFLSTPSARRATSRGSKWPSSLWHFYPRPLRGGRPPSATASRPSASYFYPRPLRGGRLKSILWSKQSIYFYPRPLRGGRLQCERPGRVGKKISIHALCEEGDVQGCKLNKPKGISIHALCEEGDVLSRKTSKWVIYFYPRPLRGGRPAYVGQMLSVVVFLSTPSARRATSKKGEQSNG